MDRSKSNSRMRIVNLRAGTSDGKDLPTGPAQDVTGIALGFRMVITEQAEVWTVRGVLSDGNATKDDIGELSFVLIPGSHEPATAITGFVAPQAPYTLTMTEDALWKNLRSIVVQLGYDQEGFYAAVGMGGRYCYYEEYDRSRH